MQETNRRPLTLIMPATPSALPERLPASKVVVTLAQALHRPHTLEAVGRQFNNAIVVGGSWLGCSGVAAKSPQATKEGAPSQLAPHLVPPTSGILSKAPQGQRTWWRRLWPESGALSAIPALDGLRTAAVILVMVFHAWYQVPGSMAPTENGWAGPFQSPIGYGRTGVHLFFVLSGFLLFQPYARWLFGMQKRPSALNFYKRRMLRVGPAYWTSLAILVLAAPLTLWSLVDALVHATFLHNAALHWVLSINGVFWTMAIEVQFYAIMPAIGVALGVLARHLGVLRATAVVAGGLLLISLASDMLERVPLLGSMPFVNTALIGHFSMASWLAIFGGGIACSVMYVYLTQVTTLSTQGRTCLRNGGNILFWAGVVIALALAFVPALHQFPGKNLIFGYTYAGMVFGVLFGAPLLRRPFESRVVRFVGLISYSLYIWHTVILSMIEPHLSGLATVQERAVLGFVLDVLLSIPVAYASYLFTERPFIAARQKAHDPAV